MKNSKQTFFPALDEHNLYLLINNSIEEQQNTVLMVLMTSRADSQKSTYTLLTWRRNENNNEILFQVTMTFRILSKSSVESSHKHGMKFPPLCDFPLSSELVLKIEAKEIKM